MADRVIIAGTTRGHENVSIAELRQMVGRAGRSHSCPIAFADIIIGKSNEPGFLERYEDPDEMEVYSTFSVENIGFYLLPEISNGRIKTISEAEKWYSRSLHSSQGFEIDMNLVFEYLLEYEAILKNGEKYFTTYIGDISSMLYFRPEDVFWWCTNFSSVFADCLENNDDAIGWALANIPTKRSYFDARIISGAFKKGVYHSNHNSPYNKMNIPNHYYFEDGHDNKITACLWTISMGTYRCPKANGRTGIMREDFGRIFTALSYLDKHCGWEMYDFLENLKYRIQYKVSAEIAEIVKLPIFTVPNAKELLAYDIYCIDDIIENEDFIKENCSFLLKQNVVRFLDGIR